MRSPSDILFLLISLAVCVTVHEAAHAWVASRLGDQTAKMQGRVSLNPFRHLDPMGTLFIIFIQFGWGRPVMVNERNLKHPRRDSALISIAGPFTNFLTAFLLALPLKYLEPLSYSHTLLSSIYQLSIVLFLFNMIPIAPLDGSKLIGIIIPRSMDAWYEHYMSQGYKYLIVFIAADYFLGRASGFSFLAYYFGFGFEYVTVFIKLVI